MENKKDEAKKYLQKILKEGDTIYGIVDHV